MEGEGKGKEKRREREVEGKGKWKSHQVEKWEGGEGNQVGHKKNEVIVNIVKERGVEDDCLSKATLYLAYFVRLLREIFTFFSIFPVSCPKRIQSPLYCIKEKLFL